ncbi:MAG TPA: hypothetical protein VFY81_15720 [Gammaproteobacteria bacterium]|nr:hypothetical protein [Gammaproteobacteria bacterium]
MRAANVYFHPDAWIVHAQHRTTAGVLLHGAPVFRLPTDATSAELGRAVRDALAGYRDGIPHPATWKGIGTEFLKLAGFRSWRSLREQSKSCWIAESDSDLTFTPLRNGGSAGKQKGFQPFGASPLKARSSFSDEEIGQVLKDAIAAAVIAV